VFERLAALERAFSRKPDHAHGTETHPARADLEQAHRELARLRGALETVAGIPVEMPDAGRRAVQVARAALGDGPVPPAR
jgi:hypothetical protein